MKALLLVPVAACAILVGCGDGSGSSASSSPGNPATASADYLGAMATAQQSAVKTVDVSTLTKAVQMFQIEQGRLPKTLDELVEMKYIPRIPEAPVGKKIVYDPNVGTVKVVAR